MRNFALLLIILLSACGSTEQPVGRAIKYFDMKTYFTAEAARLKKLDPVVRKEVVVNGKKESRSVRIADWQKELEIFIAADINKADWDGLIREHKTADRDLYTSTDKKVFVRSLSILRKAGKPVAIDVVVFRENMLYSSADTLRYIPDSLYSIAKQQDIRFLETRNYRVKGVF